MLYFKSVKLDICDIVDNILHIFIRSVIYQGVNQQW